MNAFFLRHKKLHLWLAAELLLLGAYAAVRGNGAWMTALTQSVSIPFRHGLGELSAHVPFCVMEALCALLAAFVPAYLLLGGLAVFRAEKDRRRSRLYSLLLGAACLAVGGDPNRAATAAAANTALTVSFSSDAISGPTSTTRSLLIAFA